MSNLPALELISTLVIIGGAIVGTAVWAIERGRHPSIELLRYSEERIGIIEKDKKDWGFGFQIINTGKVTASGVGVEMSVKMSNDPRSGPVRYRMFENLDILPEKIRNDYAPMVTFLYHSSSNHFELFQLQDFRRPDNLRVDNKASFETFPTMQGGIPLGYMVSLSISGPNLTDADRKTRRYLILFAPDGPHLMETKEVFDKKSQVA